PCASFAKRRDHEMARKEKSIHQLTAAEAKAEIAQIRARQKEIAARRAEIQPPIPPRPAPPGAAAGGGGYRYDPDPLKGAGPEYRRVILEGSPENLLRLELELRDLDAE